MMVVVEVKYRVGVIVGIVGVDVRVGRVGVIARAASV